MAVSETDSPLGPASARTAAPERRDTPARRESVGHDHDHGGDHRGDHRGHAHPHHDHDHDHDHEHGGHDHHHGFGFWDALRIGVAALCALGAWLSSKRPPIGEVVIGPDFLPHETVGYWINPFWDSLRQFAHSLDPWQSLGFGAGSDGLVLAVARDVLPTYSDASTHWLTLPFSTYALVGLLFAGWPIFKEAFHNLRQLRMTMELSMTIAIVAAVYTGYFFVALVIVFFVLVAEALEGLTIGRGRRAIRDLLEFLPREVSVRREGRIQSIDADDLMIGETVIVAPGGRIPVDGRVAGGSSFVDESRITGESLPVEKLAGAEVFAGSINQSGAIEVRAERIGADTSYGKIIEAVEQAERSRAPITKMADRVAAYIVLFALAAAALSQIFYPDWTTTISVLVVAGACGVAAGTPLAILGGIGRAARLGAIIKGGIHLESLARVNVVVLDKTGTLTFGEPRVHAVLPAAGVAAEDLVAAAASAELLSEHPLGKAIIRHAQIEGGDLVEPEQFGYTPGRGIDARVRGARVLVGNEAFMRENGVAVAAPAQDGTVSSAVHVARDGRFLGTIAVADEIRPEARAAIDAMHRMKIRTILLTGDSMRVAEAVGRQLGIAEVEAELLPHAKLERIEALVRQKRIVAMIGDGVNDAPALAAATVGVAMGSGTDVARESADVVLLGNDLARFADTLKLARRVKAIIWQNVIGTIMVDVVGVFVALKGWIGPVQAVQIHTVSELLFILNSARLLPRWNPLRRGGRQPEGAAGENPTGVALNPAAAE